MSSGPHHYEEAVLAGTAVVLLDLPPQLRQAEMSLRKLLDDYYPRNGITQVLLNSSPIRSSSSEDVMECGAVFFHSAPSTWALLDRLEVVLRTEDGPLELRRGYLQLGAEKILMEGVVTWGTNGRPRPTPSPQPAPVSAVAAVSTAPVAAVAAVAPVVAPTAAQAVPASSRPAVRSSSPLPHKTAEVAASGLTVVVCLRFKEVYNRHIRLREGDWYKKTGTEFGDYQLTAFMVFQMVAPEARPLKVMVRPGKPSGRQHTVTAFVEMKNKAEAAHITRVFTDRTVEFMSEADAAPPNKRQGPASPNGDRKARKPIRTELRYLVNGIISSRYSPAHCPPSGGGEPEEHHDLVQDPLSPDVSFMDVQDTARISVLAPREWVTCHRDELARYSQSKQQQQRPQEQKQQQRTQQQQQQHMSRNDRPERRQRSPARSGRDGRRTRSASPSPSSPRSRSRFSSRSSSVSSSSSSSRYPRRRPRREDEEDRRNEDTRYGRGQHEKSRHETTAPSGSNAGHTSTAAHTATPPAAAAAAAARLGEATNIQRAVQVETVVAKVEPAPLPPQPAGNGLPPGWRPIFSEEYKQTYYAYRHPQTGVETTTWERPQA